MSVEKVKDPFGKEYTPEEIEKILTDDSGEKLSPFSFEGATRIMAAFNAKAKAKSAEARGEK